MALLPLVLKLGGSLVGSTRFHAVLDLVAAANVPVVLVPGGGPFADAVRAVQPQMQLSDRLAHKLAILAMHQTGIVIASHHPRFLTAVTLEEIATALAHGQIPIWMPYALQHNDETLPADWTVTSDALAARLAERMGEADVALVKSCHISSPQELSALTLVGVVDPWFEKIVVRARLRFHLFGATDDEALAIRLGCH